MASKNLELIDKNTKEFYTLMSGCHTFQIEKTGDNLIFVHLIGRPYEFGLSSFRNFVEECQELLEFAENLGTKDGGEIAENP